MPDLVKKSFICLENKSNLKICGIDDVVAITENDVSVVVAGEILNVKGANLKAEKLSVEDGEIVIVGNINSLKFEEKKVKQGLFKRIFK